MANARELTQRYVDAYNRRDRTAMRELLPATLEFVRPGGGSLRTADEVMAQYERDWAILERSRVAIRDLVESNDAILAEITAVEGVIVHRWRDGKLVRYRYYTDPLPDEVTAVQPTRTGAQGAGPATVRGAADPDPPRPADSIR
jgi:ketosteroid isomerase-like protein